MVDTRPATLTRKLLGEFLKNPETIKAFENLSLNSEDLADVISAIQSISVLTLALSDTFENERVVASDGEVQLTDGGPGGNLTFGLSDTGVTPASYGSPAHTLQLAINAKGRITLAQAHALNSDNVAEGVANLYFTVARARASLSAGTGIDYSSASGVIAVAANGVTDAQLRQSAAFSVIGRAGNTTGNVADITAASDGHVLRRSGSTLGFGAVDLSSGGAVTGLLPVARGGSGAGSFTANKLLKGNGTGNFLSSSVTDTGSLVSIDSGVGFSVARTNVTAPAANDGNVFSGTYTPSLTGIANLDGASSYPCQYMRVGNVVTVSGRVDIDCTAAGTLTLLGISLPIASDLAADYQCAGTINAVATASMSGGIRGDAANNRAEMILVPTVTSAQGMFFTFTYLVI